MSQLSRIFGGLVSTIGLFAAFVIGILQIVAAWGFLGLIPGIPLLLIFSPVAPLWLWWIGDGFPVVFTAAWAVGVAGTLYLMTFHPEKL